MDRVELDRLATECGGRFKLTVMIQKRLKELVRGGAKLVDLEDRNVINVVMEEIRQGKVTLESFDLEEEGKESEKKSKKK